MATQSDSVDALLAVRAALVLVLIVAVASIAVSAQPVLCGLHAQPLPSAPARKPPDRTPGVRRAFRHSLVLCVTACALLPAAAAAARADGPALGIARAKLAAGLTCSPGFARSERAPVLLTPAFSSDTLSYGWNYMRQLKADGIPFCSISVPDEGYGDLQRTAKFVVFGVRRMARSPAARSRCSATSMAASTSSGR